MPEFDTVTLRDPTSSLTATYVPGAGMIATSLSDDGVELLGQRRGLAAYVSSGKSMGIPILYPWANRLSGNGYDVDDAVVTLTPGTGGVRTDEHGAPIHGILAAYPEWTVTTQEPSRLVAELDFGARPGLLASFPFPHSLTLDVSLADRALTVRTTVTPTTGAHVPLCFGFHPYLQLPHVPRTEWLVEMPAMRALPVDSHGIPTGETEQRDATAEPLGDKALDDGYDGVAAGAVFAVSGGGRRVEVHFDDGYPAAQVFAPHSDDVVCFEPMAAPTDALRRGGYRTATPDAPAVAQFRIVVG
jgi:galactose mutarotase-like enzyme